jgi:hypothetical protein
VDGDPAVLAVVLEAGYVGAEEGSKLAWGSFNQKGFVLSTNTVFNQHFDYF